MSNSLALSVHATDDVASDESFFPPRKRSTIDFHSATLPEIVHIPEGTFKMGSELDSEAERPVRLVHVKAFNCARTPVTRAMYREFLTDVTLDPGTSAVELEVTAESIAEYRALARDFEALEADDQLPAFGLSWFDGELYARWLSLKTGFPFRLPTEAEWEKAARGGQVQKSFPWGDASAVSVGANFGFPVQGEAQDQLLRVDELPRNGYGLFIGGNTWEWVHDWFDADYYKNPDSLSNPQGPADGNFRVRRGGAFNNRQSFRLRVASRNRLEPHLRFPNMGVRLVCDVPQSNISFRNDDTSVDATNRKRHFHAAERIWEDSFRKVIQNHVTLPARVEALLDVLRPSMEMDRGGVVVEAIENDRVTLRMIGTCQRCPKSSMTFADIEQTIRRYLPEIQDIARIGD